MTITFSELRATYNLLNNQVQMIYTDLPVYGSLYFYPSKPVAI